MSGWKDIVAVAVGDDCTLGLKKDGTVVATGSNSFGQCNVSDWQDITAISAHYRYSVGLKKDGTVVATKISNTSDSLTKSNDYGQCEVYESRWKDIIAISAGNYHTVGLKADSTVISTRINTYEDINVDQTNVSGWKIKSKD